MERIILTRINDTVEAHLPREQAGFRKGRSTTDQIACLVNDIEAAFQRKEKFGVVYIDLTAAYDTVWYVWRDSLVPPRPGRHHPPAHTKAALCYQSCSSPQARSTLHLLGGAEMAGRMEKLTHHSAHLHRVPIHRAKRPPPKLQGLDSPQPPPHWKGKDSVLSQDGWCL